MILLLGIATEEPMARVRAALDRRGSSYTMLDQRTLPSMSMSMSMRAGRVRGHVTRGPLRIDLADVRAIYTRAMSAAKLPAVADLAEDHPTRVRTLANDRLLARWLELTDARVINRLSAMRSNASKTYQVQQARAEGLDMPETLVTNDPDAVREFAAQHDRVIYKSVSGVRSIVRELDEDALARLDRIRWCPVQFQERVEGTDIRVHVVGDICLPTRIRTTGVDYRYANRDGGSTVLEACELSPDLQARCVALTRRLGLEIAGVDLRLRPDGSAVCFEANPSPGFSYYEGQTGQPIADAIAAHLDTGSPLGTAGAPGVGAGSPGGPGPPAWPTESRLQHSDSGGLG